MTEQPKRGRGLGRPVLANLRNAGPLLGPDETTHVHRIRADAEVNAWFAAMTAAQCGEVLARARAAEAGAPARPKVVQRPAGAQTVGSLATALREIKSDVDRRRAATPPPRPKLAGRAGEIVAHLERGAELVDGHGGMFRVELTGQVVQLYSTAVARRLLDMPGLLREVGPGRWALA